MGPSNHKMFEKACYVKGQLLIIWWQNYPNQVNYLPIYFLSLFRASKGVVKELELLQRNFFWEGRETSKQHLIRWNNICKDIYIYIYIWWFRMGVELQTET